MKNLNKNFNNNGYVILKKFLGSNKKFKLISNQLNKEIIKKYKAEPINEIGGQLIGNINCYPGKYGQRILTELRKNNLDKILYRITGKKYKKFKVLIGGNLSLPNKFSQHFHTDGFFKNEMLVVSVATSDIKSKCGPTEIIVNSHKKDIPYWKFLLMRKKKKKLLLQFGDLIIRKHCLWHRGTKNESLNPRFLIAILFFDKIRKIKLPLRNSKRIYFYNNFFGNSFLDKIKEIIYIYFKFIYVVYKLIKSLTK